jgi:hypothetical protein
LVGSYTVNCEISGTVDVARGNMLSCTGNTFVCGNKKPCVPRDVMLHLAATPRLNSGSTKLYAMSGTAKYLVAADFSTRKGNITVL